jgi:hypothetical protein
LGALNAHRGKTVDDLIQESVENFLDRESFGSCADVEEVLTQIGLDAAPFKPLYADLDQMMKRRHRIVHEADLPSPKDSVSAPWAMGDDFNLIIWLLVVLAFYAQLRVSIDPADELQRLYVARRMKAIELAKSVSSEILALQNDSTLSALLTAQKASVRLSELTAFLGPSSVEELLVIWNKMKSSDDKTTEEQARAKLAIFCRENGKR